METAFVPALAAVFPIAFAGLWLAIMALIGRLSGWSALMRRYPDRIEPSLVKLRGRSGFMGRGLMPVRLNNILTLEACPSGLRVSLPRLFGFFSKPFLVPWSEIRATPKKVLFGTLTRLGFGEPEAGQLIIDDKSWAQLQAPRLS